MSRQVGRGWMFPEGLPALPAQWGRPGTQGILPQPRGLERGDDPSAPFRSATLRVGGAQPRKAQGRVVSEGDSGPSCLPLLKGGEHWIFDSLWGVLGASTYSVPPHSPRVRLSG